MPSINGFPRLLKRKLILATFLQTDDKTALSLSSVSKSFHAAVRPQQLAKILKDVLHYRLKEHNAELLLLFLKHIFKLSALSGLAFHIKARDLNEERLRELPGWVGERCFDVGFIHGEEVKAFIKALRVLEGVRDALPEKFNITTIAALFVGTMYEGSIVQLEEHAVPDYFKPSARCYRALRGLVEERLKDVVGREACFTPENRAILAKKVAPSFLAKSHLETVYRLLRGDAREKAEIYEASLVERVRESN